MTQNLKCANVVIVVSKWESIVAVSLTWSLKRLWFLTYITWWCKLCDFIHSFTSHSFHIHSFIQSLNWVVGGWGLGRVHPGRVTNSTQGWYRETFTFTLRCNLDKPVNLTPYACLSLLPWFSHICLTCSAFLKLIYRSKLKFTSEFMWDWSHFLLCLSAVLDLLLGLTFLCFHFFFSRPLAHRMGNP